MYLTVGIIIIICGLIVGIFKQTWVLAGFNERKVENKDLLANIVGFGMLVPLGAFLAINHFFTFSNQELVIGVIMAVYIIIFISYVNIKLVK